jgi:hypothetical protein
MRRIPRITGLSQIPNSKCTIRNFAGPQVFWIKEIAAICVNNREYSVRHDRGAENQPKLQSILSILAATISGGTARRSSVVIHLRQTASIRSIRLPKHTYSLTPVPPNEDHSVVVDFPYDKRSGSTGTGVALHAASKHVVKLNSGNDDKHAQCLRPTGTRCLMQRNEDVPFLVSPIVCVCARLLCIA